MALPLPIDSLSFSSTSPVAHAGAYVLRACILTFSQLALLLGPLAVLGLLMHVVSLGINRAARVALGNHGYLVLFGGLGTAVHEACHAIACVLFRHRIVAVKWFDVNAKDGALGSVTHTYNSKSLYQSVGNFFIGVAPLLGGSALVYGAARLLAGGVIARASHRITVPAYALSSPAMTVAVLRGVWSSTVAMLFAMFHSLRLTDWRALAFPAFVFSVGSAMALSPADLRGALRGFISLVGTVLLLNVCTMWAGAPLERAVVVTLPLLSTVLPLLLFAVVLNVCVATALLVVPLLARLAWRNR